MRAEEEAVAVAEERVAGVAPRYLLVEAAQRRAAIPLEDVLRIELVSLSRVEYVGYRAVLNFSGQLLPVDDAGGVIAPGSARWASLFIRCWMWLRGTSYSRRGRQSRPLA